MANVIRYKTSQPTKRGKRRGDVVVGTGEENYGPTSTTGYVNGITPPDGGYVVYTLSGNNDPAIYVADDDNGLIDIARTLGGGELNYLEAKNYLNSRSNTWILDSIPKNTITDGLVVDLNTKNESSFIDNMPTSNLIYTNSNVYQIGSYGNTVFPIIFPGEVINGSSQGAMSWADHCRWWNETIPAGTTISISGWYMAYNSNSSTAWQTSARLIIYSSAGYGGTVCDPGAWNTWCYFEMTYTCPSDLSSFRLEDAGYDYYNSSDAPNTAAYTCNVQIETTATPTPFTTGSRSQNTTWYDLSGNSNDGTLTNSPTFSNGVITFDGVNDYATISSNSTFNVNTRTVELTFKMNGSYSNFAPLAVYANGSSSTNRVWLGLQSSKFQMHGWGTSDPAATTTIDADRWYTCVWSYDKGTQKMKMYTNGILENDHSQTQGGVNGASGMNWYLAYMPGGSSWQGQTYANVSFNSFKVYDKILSNSEVSQNYYGGSIVTDELKLNLDVSNLVSFETGSTNWYDMVNSNYSASLVGNVGYSTTYKGTLNVDGSQTSDYIILPHQVLDNDISSNGAWSLECWLRMDSTSGTTYFFSTATPSTTNGWIIQKANATVFPWNETLQNGSAISFTAGETFHLTLTINGSSIYLYKNGSYIGRYSYTKDIANANGWVLNQEQDALLGGFDSSQATDMGINIIRVYNKTLSDSEVLQNFNAQKARFGL